MKPKIIASLSAKIIFFVFPKTHQKRYADRHKCDYKYSLPKLSSDSYYGHRERQIFKDEYLQTLPLSAVLH